MSGDIRDRRLAASPLGTGRDLRHGPRDQNAVALTFDDGRDAGVVRSLTSILSDLAATATFFPTARRMRQDPAAWQAVAAAGLPVGNHGSSHRDMRTLDPVEMIGEITGFRRLAESILGTPTIPWFRPPYGSWDERVADAAVACGYPNILLWDVDTYDWADPGPESVRDRALAGGPGSIILMHAGSPSTVSALPDIIAGYRARGLELRTIPDLFGQSVA